MKRSVAISVLISAHVATLFAQDKVRDFSWSDLKKAGQLTAGEIQSESSSVRGQSLKIDNPTDQPQTVNLLDVTNPGVTTLHYSLDGSVRYEHVKGRSYLEMWSYFADGGMCFSRTLADSGPMGNLEGTSDWRPFSLPCFSDKKIGLPTRLVVNVVFVDRGTVYLSPIKLVQYREGWWTEQTGGWIGGIGGSIIGLLGALIGVLAGLGKARRFVFTLMIIMIILGAVSLLVGLISLPLGQPYEVYYPLLLGGVILVTVVGGNLYTLRRRYEQIELRKMAAMDAR